VVSGKDLVEKEKITHYQAPFDDLPIIQKIAQSPHFHSVVLSKDLVNEEEGTGLVHIVPGAGTEDHQLVKKELGWLDVIFPVVDEEGNYVQGYGFLTGKNAKDHPELIIDYLKEKDGGRYLFKTENYTHPYPICWRCKTELIWRLVDEWYIAMDKKITQNSNGKTQSLTLRERMIRVAKRIRWLPEFGLKRELDWLKNMGDWMISKKRYWGLSLPIWQCECGYFEVIGSKEELKEKAATGWKEFEGHTPHRPWIDKVKIKCPKCGKLMNRIPDVGNPWLDAGIVPFSTLIDPKTGQVSYLTDKKYWREWFPADFITECFPGQFRNWFYSLIAMATELEDKKPTKTILGHALVRDEKGEEMHKTKGNAIWFDEAAEKMGVDTMRWLYARQEPQFNLNMGYRIADEVRRQFIFLYWNTYRFFVTYANLNGWKPLRNSKQIRNSNNQNPKQFGILDNWILSRLESTKSEVTQKLDDYHHYEAIAEIEKFLEDLSTWYIRRSRDRINPNNPDQKDTKACLTTLYHVLEQLTLILAPFIPFLTETVWQNLHNLDWSVDNSVHLQDWPKFNQKLIDQELEGKMAFVRQIVSLGHAIRKEKQIKVRQPLKRFMIYDLRFKNFEEELIQLIKEELNVKEVQIKAGREKLEVKLDTKITPELKEEGEARELIRQIQILRRQQSLSVADKITILAPSWPKKWEKEILSRTNAVEIEKGKALAIRKSN
jgi:isoleucyl-tRNA synthetase